jgi:hypothetical protein
MNTKQRKQVIALVVLSVLWGISAAYNRRHPPPPVILRTKAAAKAVQTDSPLMVRFRRIRSEMDALYHYRIKPKPFDPSANPFRIPGLKVIVEIKAPKDPVPPPTDYAEILLKQAVANMKIGGVMTMHGTTQLTVDGQLHKQGDVFMTKVLTQLVPIRIRTLSTASVTLSLDDPDVGSAETKVRLK